MDKTVHKRVLGSARNKYLLKKYGITEQEYEEMFKAQWGVCTICGTAPKPGRRLAVDHIHLKGKNKKPIEGNRSLVRGLLCMFCNKYVVGAIERRNIVSHRDLINGLMNYFDRYQLKDEYPLHARNL